MSILIGADIVPVASNAALFENAQIDELLGQDLRGILKRADYRIYTTEKKNTISIQKKESLQHKTISK